MMTGQELRDAIAYHRKVHRPYLFAPAAGPMSECGMPTCRAVMAELAGVQAEHDHEQADMTMAAIAYGDGSPAAAVAYHLKHCAQAGGAIVMHHPGESADEVIARLTAAGWTLQDKTDHVAGKRIRYVVPPGGTPGT
jgi:hypothetical protein